MSSITMGAAVRWRLRTLLAGSGSQVSPSPSLSLSLCACVRVCVCVCVYVAVSLCCGRLTSTLCWYGSQGCSRIGLCAPLSAPTRGPVGMPPRQAHCGWGRSTHRGAERQREGSQRGYTEGIHREVSQRGYTEGIRSLPDQLTRRRAARSQRLLGGTSRLWGWARGRTERLRRAATQPPHQPRAAGTMRTTGGRMTAGTACCLENSLRHLTRGPQWRDTGGGVVLLL